MLLGVAGDLGADGAAERGGAGQARVDRLAVAGGHLSLSWGEGPLGHLTRRDLAREARVRGASELWVGHGVVLRQDFCVR
ncbi:hypothetical protein BBK82_46235 [Lentzea guizhouensis]|uniref:Uncharacterized protein n=1 Tax=Lentzea guizhouensis TaxID=1586287 RepID=A0A1B2HX12_9PSEU|nr:hypothetical protein [Lentzea guizhouensis]ANZ42243.1 hypothetical protein BBK82_46235 [Lentzea guizhouensis]